jgi:hypothetical protein
VHGFRLNVFADDVVVVLFLFSLCVLKKCLSMCPLSDFLVFSRRFILEYTLEFVNNQYGNYLIQHILERVNAGQMGPQPPQQITTSTPQSPHPRIADADDPNRHQLPSINELLYAKLRGHFARLSRQKFSSNVVEKCLRIPVPHLRTAIVAELIEADSVASMLLCSYGNYVLQNVLYVASQEECAILFSRVRPEHVLSSLRKNIRMKWERLLANAHLIHPGLALPPVEGSIEHQQMMAQQQGQAPGSPQLGAGGQPMFTIRGITPGVVADSGQPSPHANLYPSAHAIQLITSILGANTPGSTGTANIAYEAAAAAAAANAANSPNGAPTRTGSNPSFVIPVFLFFLRGCAFFLLFFMTDLLEDVVASVRVVGRKRAAAAAAARSGGKKQRRGAAAAVSSTESEDSGGEEDVEEMDVSQQSIDTQAPTQLAKVFFFLLAEAAKAHPRRV